MMRVEGHCTHSLFSAATAAIALLCLLGTPLHSAQPDRQEAEIQYAQGLYALNSGDDHEALQRFEAAHARAPGEPRHHFFMGLARNRLSQYSEALKNLQDAKRLGGNFPGLPYEMAVAHMGLNHWDEAAALLKDAQAAQPRRGEVYLRMGVVEDRRGDTSAAMTNYEKALALDPSLQDQVAFYRGRTYLQDGMVDLAKQEFSSASSSDNKQINSLSDDYLGRIEIARDGAPDRWDFTGWFGVSYDDNVVLNPEDPGVLTISDQEDVRVVIAPAVHFRPWIGENGMFGIGLSAYSSMHQDLDEFDLLGVTPELEYRFQNDKALFRATASYGIFERDGDDYLEFLNVTLRPGVRQKNVGRTEVILAYRDEDFEFDERDGDEQTIGIEQFVYPWTNKRQYLSGLLSYTDHDAGNDFAREELAAGLKFYTPLGGAWDFFVGLYYTEFEYDNVHSFFDTMRDDEEYKAVLRATYDIKDWLALVMEYRITEHESNIAFFDYDRQIVTVGILARP